MLSQFGQQRKTSQKGYRRFVEEGMREPLKDPLRETVAGVALGGRVFVERIQAYLKGRNGKERDLPALRKIKLRPTLAGINKLVLSGLKDRAASGCC